jgi:hypothetical protein
LAAKFPLFKPGQVLLSMRNLDTIAVLDRQTHRVTWAAQGIWRIQHDAEFLDNGHLLLYDNFGSMRGTRILEYDPLTQAIPWAYLNDNSKPFSAAFRGMKQRLCNGNTLIVDPDNRRLLEVTQDKEIVWECFCPLPPVPQDERPRNHVVNCARRYGADDLTFLKRGGANHLPSVQQHVPSLRIIPVWNHCGVPTDERLLLWQRAGRRRCAVVVLREPPDHRVTVAHESLVSNQLRVQALQNPVQAPGPLRDRDQFPHADEVAADTEHNGVAARQPPQAL